MVIVIEKGAEKAQVENLKGLLRSRNIDPQETEGSLQTIIGCVGDVAHVDPGMIEALDVVESVCAFRNLTRPRTGSSIPRTPS